VTYRSGWKKFQAFLAIENFYDPLEYLSLPDIRALMIFYMDFARRSRSPPLQANTIDQYFCHVAERLVLLGVIDDSATLRCTRSRFLLTSFRLEDTIGRPLRREVAIPLSCALLHDALAIIRRLFAHDPALIALVSAGFAFGYGASCRPGEYSAIVGRHVDLDHQVSSSMTHFWFEGMADPLCVTHPAAYPPGLIPTHLTSLLDRRKKRRPRKRRPYRHCP